MTQAIQRFLNVHLRPLPAGARVLEVGSYDVNGKADTSRFQYIGLDMREGPNVDIVCNAHSLPFAEESFDCVICAETLEHDDEPLRTLSEIRRVLKGGGVFLCTVPSIHFARHDYPSDYWRVTAEGMKVWLKDFRIEMVEELDKCIRAVAYKQ